ncbi:MAG: hypothetical protein JXA73_03505 [Acidobacteria bacterium]|nr:hypothetical protein [Acidobacteriota bacterium]
MEYQIEKERSAMPGLKLLLILGAAVFLTAIPDSSNVLFAQNKSGPKYQVLSPWAEVDPIPLRGLTAKRLDTLAGKKIGLFVNYKRAARPIGESVERRLKAMYPDTRISYFVSTEWNVSVVETKNKDKFEAWAKEVDAVILSVGD